MRSTSHASGSPAAQADLASLAGWTPSRRGFLGSLLVTGAATTAAGTAAALAIPSAAPTMAGVSPRLAALIADHARAWKVLEDAPDLEAETAAMEALDVVWVALMAEPVAHAVDFAAKYHSLVEHDNVEGDTSVLKRLGDDANRLAQVAK